MDTWPPTPVDVGTCSVQLILETHHPTLVYVVTRFSLNQHTLECIHYFAAQLNNYHFRLGFSFLTFHLRGRKKGSFALQLGGIGMNGRPTHQNMMFGFGSHPIIKLDWLIS